MSAEENLDSLVPDLVEFSEEELKEVEELELADMSLCSSSDGVVENVQILKYLEDTFCIPLPEELNKLANDTQTLLEMWSDNRIRMRQQFLDMAKNVDEWEKKCAISTTIGTSLTLASECITIAGMVMAYYVTIPWAVVENAFGASNLVASLVTRSYWKKAVEDVEAVCAEDRQVFEKLLETRKELWKAIEEATNSGDYVVVFGRGENKLKKITNMLGTGVLGAAGLGAKYMETQTGLLAPSSVKDFTKGVTAVNLVVNSRTFYKTARNLARGKPSKFGEQLRELALKLEIDRRKVCKTFFGNFNEEAEEGYEENEFEHFLIVKSD